jgi:hypothetical protein
VLGGHYGVKTRQAGGGSRKMKKQSFVLIGNNNNGKSELQRCIVDILTGNPCQRLNVNTEYDVAAWNGAHSEHIHVRFMSRSFQEIAGNYANGTIEEYFNNTARDCNVWILSSHLDVAVIQTMIEELHKRFFNVSGVFFQNSVERNPADNQQISQLCWDQRIFLDNPVCQDGDGWMVANHIAAFELCRYIMRE